VDLWAIASGLWAFDLAGIIFNAIEILVVIVALFCARYFVKQI
jgi:hypothetical protein